MSLPQPGAVSRRALLQRSGVLAVVSPRPASAAAVADAPEADFDLHLCLTEEGEVYAFSGHVDLGTGIRTALAQIVAEELDLAPEAVTMVLGDTENAPDQGPTIASETIQVTSVPLRIAAAQARRHLLDKAAAFLSSAPHLLTTRDGMVSAQGVSPGAVSYFELLRNTRTHLPLAESAEFKPVSEHRVVGRDVRRSDIPAKAAGSFVYVHDIRVPGMLHGRVVRPPYAGLDGGDFVGRSLIAVDRSSVAHVPGLVAVVVEGDFVGVVAQREEHAAEAASALKLTWKVWSAGADPGDVETALRAQPIESRRLVDEGDVDAALAAAATRLDRTYVWPFQMHGSIGPSCAVADVRTDGMTVWSGTQNPYPLRADLALLTGMAEDAIEIVRAEAAGCYGRNCASGSPRARPS